jgi:hypothetical protein
MDILFLELDFMDILLPCKNIISISSFLNKIFFLKESRFCLNIYNHEILSIGKMIQNCNK